MIEARFFRIIRAVLAGFVLLLAGCTVTPPGPLLSGPLPPLPTTGGKFNVNERDYGDTFIVTLRDPATAVYETQGLRVSG